jgi:hypothetical protein
MKKFFVVLVLKILEILKWGIACLIIGGVVGLVYLLTLINITTNTKDIIKIIAFSIVGLMILAGLLIIGWMWIQENIEKAEFMIHMRKNYKTSWWKLFKDELF